MKQILQNMSNGETTLVEVPVRKVNSKSVLIEARKSLISVGTERMLVEFGQANLIEKARKQPDKVKEVLAKIGTDGLSATYGAVKSKLDQPLAIGYSHVGVVVECGRDVTKLKSGDRVVSNGSHASAVVVSENLVCKIPDSVSDDDASFTVLSSIALQGIRLVDPTLGETVVVVGLGVIGLLTVQILLANGCNVIGVELDNNKLEIARGYGAATINTANGDDPVKAVHNMTSGRGADAVIITASAKSNQIISQSARMCRKRGRVVLVGVVGLDLNRADFYENEISFQVSCSYGPGRYDPNYEALGNDYPIGYVRWTENRNFEAVLGLMEKKSMDLNALITHKFDFNDAVDAYKLLNSGEDAIGILLEYPTEDPITLLQQQVKLSNTDVVNANSQQAIVAFVGAGNYASRALIPAFRKAGATLHTLVSLGGVSAAHHGEKNGFKNATTLTESVFDSSDINTVVVATRHNSHSEHVLSALQNRKNVFVEKPLALTHQELNTIEKCYLDIPENERPRLMVGFNRRFSPLTVKLKSLIDQVNEPKVVVMTMNAGFIPVDSWVQDKEVGGGRIIGEACHYIDLMRHLIGSQISSSNGICVSSSDTTAINEDKAIIQLQFEDGSIGSIQYLANGGKMFPKERVEVFAGDAVLQLDNFRALRGFGWKGFKRLHLLKQNKGQSACAAAFLKSIEDGAVSPISFDEVMEVSRHTINVANILDGANHV